ncbi:MAG TPA: hypothetical protein VHL11_17595 [Phototrophicaceae bacterium]|nr:hypothetical protein [Phototrophicaceae bacterium]
MDTETSVTRNLNNVERLVRDLLTALQKAKLMDEPVVEELRLLEAKLGQARRAHFDQNNPEYTGF